MRASLESSKEHAIPHGAIPRTEAKLRLTEPVIHNMMTEEVLGHVEHTLKLPLEEQPEQVKNFMYSQMHHQAKSSINTASVEN
mmetsp:Transcript_19922/g.30677  ORF Transcript_19922/g.30677 Transcript_19922/m.30677 type:complete len:83 (+) Transcript_19922:618-866(+)